MSLQAPTLVWSVGYDYCCAYVGKRRIGSVSADIMVSRQSSQTYTARFAIDDRVKSLRSVDLVAARAYVQGAWEDWWTDVTDPGKGEAAP